MAAVGFGTLSGVLFGVLAVTVRIAVRRGIRPEVGATVIAAVGFLLAVALAAAAGGTVRPEQLWPYLIAGAIVPGMSQIVFVGAIRDAGPSRAAILIGTAPLISIVVALTLLGEPFRVVLVAGTVLIVAGGAALARERTRPEGFLTRGVVLALVCAGLFAARDNVVRWASRGEHPPPLVATAATLLAATAFLTSYLAATNGLSALSRIRAAALPFVPAGLALGAGYACLLEAFSRGRVSVVAPLNATQSLWAMLFSTALLGRTERVGARLVLAGILVVGGGALIGVFR